MIDKTNKGEKITTTLTTYGSSFGINFDDMERAIAKIKPMTDEMVIKIEVCKKHYKYLQKNCKQGDFNGISGIPLFIMPYLKKAKVYQKNGVIKRIAMLTKKDLK